MALKVAVIGATGSVGKQTLEVIDRFPDKFVPTLLVAVRTSKFCRFWERNMVVQSSVHGFMVLQNYHWTN